MVRYLGRAWKIWGKLGLQSRPCLSQLDPGVVGSLIQRARPPWSFSVVLGAEGGWDSRPDGRQLLLVLSPLGQVPPSPCDRLTSQGSSFSLSFLVVPTPPLPMSPSLPGQVVSLATCGGLSPMSLGCPSDP